MTTKQGATQALRLTLPGAPKTWHSLGGIDGLYHPDIAVPLDALGVTEAQARQWTKEPGVPLALEQITQAEADDAREAYRVRIGVDPTPEADAVDDQAAPEAANPDPPEEG